MIGSLSRRRSAFTLVIAALLLLPAVGMPRANAASERQLNNQGWARWFGEREPASYLYDQAILSVYLNQGYPTTISTEEMCAGLTQYGPYQYLWSDLNALTQSFAGAQLYTADTYKQHGYNDAACDWFGPAIFAFANSPGSTWSSPWRVAYPSNIQSPSETTGGHTRGYICAFPAFAFGNYAACSTHLATNSNASYRNQQAAYFRDNAWAVFGLYGTKGALGADLNGTRSGSSAINSLAGYSNTIDAGPSGVATCCSSSGTPSEYTNRYDYVLLINSWGYQSAPVVAIPYGRCAVTDHYCVEPPGFLVADHKTVVVFYG